MSAESSLTAVAVVRALLDEDTEGLAVLLPDGPPGARPRARSQPGQPDSPLGQGCRPGREGITEGEYLDRIIRLWTDNPR